MRIHSAMLRDKTDAELIAIASDLTFQLDLVGDEQTRRIIEALQHKNSVQRLVGQDAESRLSGQRDDRTSCVSR